MKRQLMSVLFIFWVYLVFGGFVFSAIERPHFVGLHHDFVVAEALFTLNNSCVNQSDLQRYSNVLIEAYSGGLKWNADTGFEDSDDLDDDGYHSYHWDFMDSLFFAATVVTTIGYGHLAPKTYLGMTLCIPYALFGIPLSGLLVTIIGQNLKRRLLILWKRFLDKVYSVTSATSSSAHHIALATSVTVAGIFFYVILIIIPAFCFYKIEGWDWLTSHYYSFISFSTIGFGDLVAGNNPTLSVIGRIVYKIILIFYLVFGMGFMTLCLQAIQLQNAERVQRLAERKVIRRIMKKRRIRKQGEKADTISKTTSSGDDEYVIITQVIDGEQYEMCKFDQELEYETISMCEAAMQTVPPPNCTKSTQTEQTDTSQLLNAKHTDPVLSVECETHSDANSSSSTTPVKSEEWGITVNTLSNGKV